MTEMALLHGTQFAPSLFLIETIRMISSMTAITECVEVRKYNVVTNHGIKVLESFNCFSGQALSIDEIEVVRDRLRILLRQSDNARLALLSFFLESGVKECGIFSQHVSVNHHLMFVGPNDKSD
jgi:hypothetical protein